jgi:hypothetical protein
MSWPYSRYPRRKLCYDYRAEKNTFEKKPIKNQGGSMSHARIAIAILFIALPSQLVAQAKKGIRLWNLTTATISGFQLSPAGKADWGPNQTLNDKDKEVDHDERLRIIGVEPGRYDAKVSYRDARQCIVRDIEIRADAVFSIEDKDLKDCNK